jgi:hypothetical protein
MNVKEPVWEGVYQQERVKRTDACYIYTYEEMNETHQTLFEKGRGEVQVAMYLPSKLKAPSSTPSTSKQKKKGVEGGG